MYANTTTPLLWPGFAAWYQLEVVPEDCARIRRTILVLYAAYGGLTANGNV